MFKFNLHLYVLRIKRIVIQISIMKLIVIVTFYTNALHWFQSFDYHFYKLVSKFNLAISEP